MGSRNGKKGTVNKSSDAINVRRGKALYEQMFKKYGIEGITFQDRLIALGQMFSNNGVEKLGTEIECHFGTKNGDHIDCAKDFDQKGRIHKVSDDFCEKCWERQQRKKVGERTQQVESMKAEIHRYQERVNQTVKEQKERIIICPKTDLVIPSDQCQNCDSQQQKRCQIVFRDSEYQREVAKVRILLD